MTRHDDRSESREPAAGATEPAVYALRTTRPAVRALTDELPEAVAIACLEFIRGDLLIEPFRVGKPLHRPLEHHFAARRGTYRVVFTINERLRIVTVVSIEHRSDVYRT